MFFFLSSPCLFRPRHLFRVCARVSVFSAAVDDGGVGRCGVLRHEEKAEERWLVVRPPS